MKTNPYTLALGVVQKRASKPSTTNNGIPTWAKLVLIGVAGFVVYKVYKKLTEEKFSRKEDREATTELDKLNSNPATKQTLTKLQAQMIANQLHTAMDGSGTNEDTIINSFLQVRNDADFVAVSSAYGIRPLHVFGLVDFTGNLTQSLTNELGNSDAKWKNKLNEYLKARKIKYQI